MLSSNNILSPASGKPLALPRLDMVTGPYFLTMKKVEDEVGGEGAYTPADDSGPARRVLLTPRVPSWPWTVARLACRRRSRSVSITCVQRRRLKRSSSLMAGEKGQPWMMDTTVGRIQFNELPPYNFPYQEGAMVRKGGGDDKVLLRHHPEMVEKYPMDHRRLQTLDKLKDAGFYRATCPASLSQCLTF